MNKNICKRLFVALGIIMTLCLMILPVKAVGLTATTSSVSGSKGNEVTVTVTLSEKVNVISGAISFEYDKNALSLTAGSFNVPGATLANWDQAKQLGAFMFMGGGDVSGTIFSATFKILDGAEFGANSVKAIVQLTDTSNAAISVTNVAGAITVECKHSFTKQDTSDKYLASAADCTNKAKYYYACAYCGAKGTTTFESGSTTAHNFTKQDTNSKYLASAADCTHKAKYYYSCTGCGTKGTETFESGTTAAHSYTKKDTSSTFLASAATCTEKAKYYYSCAGCGVKGTTTFEDGEALGHTGGSATCTKKAVCTRCNKEYGELLAHTYTAKKEESKYLKNEANCTTAKTYYYSCKDCGATGTETFTVGSVAGHKFDKKIETAKYIAKSGTCTEAAEYYYACSTCEEKGTVTYKGSTAKGHVYGDKWYTDANNHWHECNNCIDKKDLAAHTPGAAATETTPQTCTTCGYVIKAALGHEHNFDVTEYKTDANNHWYECSCGEKAEVKAHTYDNDCDKDCNGCGYEREVTHTFGSWVSDDANHWKECSCGEKSEVAAHTPGAEATETTPQTCTVCNHVLKEAVGHTHNYGSEWKKDSENHWHECECGDKKDVSAHKYDNGVVKEEATEDKEGLKVYSCVCGYEKTETLPKLEPAKKGCKKDLAALVVGVISLSMVGVLLKRKEN